MGILGGPRFMWRVLGSLEVVCGVVGSLDGGIGSPQGVLNES